jgi:glycosyltransferase involved in cell wall biosynthesis
VLETVAAQKPIICTNVGGIPEIMGEDCASMVRPGDADALGAIMAKAVDEKDWLASCLPNRDEFTQRFSVQTMAENLSEIYQKARKKAA